MERVVLFSLISLCSLGGVLAAFSNADVGTLGDPSFTSRSSGYGGVRYRSFHQWPLDFLVTAERGWPIPRSRPCWREVSAPRIHPVQVRLLLVTAMVSSAAGLVLELLLVTQASYLSGDATLATGVVVGTFLAAMGLGAWLSQFLAQRGPLIERLLKTLVWVELALAPLCLLGPLALYLLFWLDGSLWLGTTVFTVLVGVLAGMELPLITRLLESQQELRRALARVLALDYLGSLVGALLFPLVLLPLLGLLPTAGAPSLIPVVSALLLTLHFLFWRPGDAGCCCFSRC